MRNYYKSTNFQYEPKATRESIDAAVDWLKEHKVKTEPKESTIIKTGNFSGFYSLGNFAWFRGGSKVDEIINAACHYYLSSYNASRSADCVALWCSVSCNTEWVRFYDYFVNRSFASQFILAHTEDGVVVSSDIPCNLMHCLAMMSRAPRQFPPEMFKRFNKLVDNSVPEDIAYLVSFCINNGPDEAVFRADDNHRPFMCPGISGMKRFMNGQFRGVLDRELYRYHTSMSCSGFLGGSSTNSFVSELLAVDGFKEELAEYRRGGDSDMYRPPNPFKRVDNKPRLGEMTIKEVHEVGIPFLMKKGVFNAE